MALLGTVEPWWMRLLGWLSGKLFGGSDNGKTIATEAEAAGVAREKASEATSAQEAETVYAQKLADAPVTDADWDAGMQQRIDTAPRKPGRANL